MQSPFSLFRKNQKMMMVILIGMAMFSFIILGTLDYVTEVPTWVWVVVLGLVGAGVGWVIGVQTADGKPKEYALSGLLLCVSLGILLMLVTRKAPAVETTAGNLTEKDLRTMITNRQTATRFMRDCYMAAVERPPKPKLPWEMVQQFMGNESARPYVLEHQRVFDWEQGRDNAAFGIPERMPIREEGVIDKYLLLQEAKELGIEVNDDAVVAYIHRMAKGITKKAYLDIRKEAKLSEPELFDILREEIAIQQVFRLRVPYQFAPPSNYWRRYRQMNVTQNLELIAVPTGSFIAELPEPTDKQLESLFEKHKEKKPSNAPSPDPAFGLPERVQISYFQANFGEVEKDVLKKLAADFLTQDEIKTSLKAIDDEVASVEMRIADKSIKPELAEKERLNARRDNLRTLLTSKGKINRLDFEIVQHYEFRKNQDFLNTDWSPPFPGLDGPGKKDPFLKTDEPAEAIKPKVAPSTPSKTTPSKKTSDRLSVDPFRSVAALLFAPAISSALLQPEKTTTPVIEAKKPATGKTVAVKPVRQQPPPPPLPEDPPLPEVPPYQPLTAELRERIRKIVLPTHVLREVRKRLKKAAGEMERYASKRINSSDNENVEFSPTQAAEQLRKKAREWGLEFVTTEPFSELDFVRSAEYPMNNAGEVFDISENARFSPNARPIHQVLFQREGEGQSSKRLKMLYRVIRAATTTDGRSVDNLFVLWKTSHLDAAVPEFTDKGVREKVIAAWKDINARPLAKKRAEELKTLIASAGKPMTTALAGVTVTGKPESAVLKPVRTDRSLSWLTQPQSSAPQVGQNQNAQPFSPSEIPGTEKIGQDFRETIFEDLQDGELGVAPSSDRSVYYVVRVLDRHPTTTPGREDHMRRLLEDSPMGGGQSYGVIANETRIKSRELQRKVLQQLREKYQLKRKTRTGENEN